jgi:hypothetical protein
LYQYRSVPFGIATGAQVINRRLDLIFHDVKLEFVYHYLDDLVIYIETFDQHLDNVNQVLSGIPWFYLLPLNKVRRKITFKK